MGINHTGRAHALLSASSSGRWLACPPSAVAAATYPATETTYTREGTLAHEVAEALATGRGVEVTTNPEITTEMIRHAQGYADYVQELITDPGAVVLYEQRLDFSPWVPGGFGTGDALVIQGNRLDVIDYKYGQGVAVAAKDNSQMRLYALGALNDFGDIYDIAEIAMHIYQPRIGNVSVDVIRVSDLLEWAEQVVKPAAALAADGKGDFSAGAHCRFCPHAGACPSLAASCLRVVNDAGGVGAVPTLTPWMVSDLLQQEPAISAWLRAVKDRAMSMLMGGQEVPGYKLVAGRGTRAWGKESDVIAALKEAGHVPEEFTELLSPAAMEKALGKKHVTELVGALIVTKSGAPTLAPASDKRKPFDPVAEARADFT